VTSTITTSLLLLTASLGFTACATDDASPGDDTPSWEAFQDAARRDFDGHVSYVVDGDMPVSLDGLRAFYDQHVAGTAPIDKSTVNTVGGRDDVWNADQKRDLTYCVTNDFGGAKGRAVSEVYQAAKAWEAVANVRFRYVPSQDGACVGTNTAVTFAVRPWSEGGACAFFPSGDSCVPRTLVMDFTDFDTNPTWDSLAPNLTTTGVFRHELGHILGLRHEHIRGGSCNEGGTSRDLTPYDRGSVMHYQWCGGVTASDMNITASDTAGVRQLYGARSRNGTTGKVTTVSRIAGSMETLWVASNGSVQGAYWYQGGSWGRFQLAPAGSAAVDGGISLVSRFPSTLEAFWVAPNGSVQGAYWYEGGTWQRYQLAGPGSASTSAGATGISRISNSLEVFWVGPSGSIQGAYWYEGGSWQLYQLAPAYSASTTGDVTAISRRPDHFEVFWPAANGSVQAAFWYEGGVWTRFQLAGAGSASPSATIGGVARIHNSMEIFWPASNGSVQAAYWYEGGAWTRYELSAAGTASTVGGVTALSRIPGHLEVFWPGADGVLRNAYWYEGGSWGRQTIVGGNAARTSTAPAGVSRIPGSMEIFYPSSTSSLDGAYWYEGGAWTRYTLAAGAALTAGAQPN
jgi:hypothetical protein